MKVAMLRVGIDTGSGGIHGPLFLDGTFEYVSIPDGFGIEKALQQIRTEVSIEKSKQLVEQEKQEIKQTAVDLEIARRDKLVAQERAKVYETNPGWLRLQVWKEAKEVFSGDNVWFIDPNADLTLLFSGENVVPVEAGP
jgi:hypothetical protein